jgi:hypothetical protein
MAKVTYGAFLNGRLVTSVTVDAVPRQIESAIRLLRDSYPEAQIFRKVAA